MRLYLAHPFSDRAIVRKWELGFEERSGIDIVNPFFDEEGRTDMDIITDESASLKTLQRINLPDDEAKQIVERDIKTIISCDGVIAIIGNHITYGTIQEIVYAYLLHRPVYLVITNGYEHHIWLRYHCEKIFTQLEDLEDFLMSL